VRRLENILTSTRVSYLINLDRRPDRWQEFVDKSSELDLPISRFSAVDGLEISKTDLRLPSSVAACWMSHQAVAREMLASGAEHCLVLEDDIELNHASILGLTNLWKMSFQNIDLLQVGFCVNHHRLSNRVVHYRQSRLVELMHRSKLLNLDFTRRILKFIYGYEFRTLNQLNQPVAVMTFELGTHAYIMSSKFAHAILSFNFPVYLPADLALMELTKTDKYNVFRLNRSLINQSDSPSSISNASTNTFEKEIARLISSWIS
jgi:GR25 family glycosyltransferase involved in LPS biosynthesis